MVTSTLEVAISEDSRGATLALSTPEDGQPSPTVVRPIADYIAAWPTVFSLFRSLLSVLCDQVAISAAVLSKSGRVLLARQFVPISRQRIEGYLASFPKLVPVDNQHTIIDTEHIRYIYQPLEALYLLLITNKHSNIMEDIDTLRTLAKLIPEYCLGVTEEAVQQHVYELLFAFDEAIAANGYKESVTPAQVKTYTEMDSHEEKLQRIIEQTKMQQAAADMKRKAAEIEKQRDEMKKLQAITGGGSGGDNRGKYGGMGSGGSMSGGSSYDDGDRDRERQREADREREEKERERARAKGPSPTGGVSTASKPRGMQLSTAKKEQDFMNQLNKEEKLAAPVRGSAAASAATAASAAPAKQDSVRVVVREKLVCEVEKDGSVKRVEVKGELKLQILDPDYARIILHTVDAAGMEKAGFKCSLHPKIDKKLWASSQQLGSADRSKGFPVGSEKETTIVKWRKVGDENDVPFTISFWPNAEGGSTSVNVEYNNVSGRPLADVVIRIPLSTAGEPDVTAVTGDWKYEPRAKQLVWRVADVSGDAASGQLEFTCGAVDTDALYPISVEFVCDELLSGLKVSGVTGADDGAGEVEFAADHKLEVEKYTIE